MMIMVAWTCLMSSAHTTLNLSCSWTQHWTSHSQCFSNCSLRNKLKRWWVCRCWIIPRGVGVPSPVVLAAQLQATTAQARRSSSGARHSCTSCRDGSWCPWVTLGARLRCSSWLAAARCFFTVTWCCLSHVGSSLCWSPRSRVIWCQHRVGTVWHRCGFGSLFCNGHFCHVGDWLGSENGVKKCRGVPFELLQQGCAK